MKTHHSIIAGSKRAPLTLSIGALVLGLAVTGPARAQNLVTNGDFSANAASFGTFPGYFGGANPGSAPGWTTTGSGINGLLAPGTGNPFAPATNVPSFLFMQGDVTASQAIATVAATDYLFTFDGAARNGTGPAGVSVFADNTQAASLVVDASLGWLPQNAFQRAAFGFTATGAQTIQFNSSGIGDHTTDITNVSVMAATSPGVWDITNGTFFFTEPSGTQNYGFALTGDNQAIVRRPGSATYTGNISTDGSAGALTFVAVEDAGTNNLTFSGSTIALGPKNFVVTGFTVDGEGEAANSKVTLNNVALTTSGSVEVGRGSLEISGSTSLGIGGQLRTGVNGDWARFVMNPGTSVTAPGGVNFRANGVIASSMYLNGGTLTTPSITGNDFGGGHTIFNGTTVIASASNADFLDVHLNGSGAAYSAAAQIGNGGAIFDTNGNDITINNALVDFGGNNGSLTKQGNGTLTLTTANTFTGATKVTAGTLIVAHDQALQTSALDTSGAGVVSFPTATPTVGGLKGGGNLASVISGYSGVTALTLNPAAANVTNTYSGGIANGAPGMTLTKTGAGTQILSGTNTYTGATTIAEGTLILQGTSTAPMLTDNFSATGNPDTNDLNFNLAARQTGTESLQSWTPAGNTQVGNPTVVQQPAGTNGDYLLLAFGGSATLNGMPLSTANAPGPIKVSFDMFKGTNTINNTTEWTSFTMRSAGGNGFPITGSGEFGFLHRQNTGIQIFNNGGLLHDLGSTAGGDSFGFYLADSAGTGSPFAGNGTRLVVTQGPNTLGSYALNTGAGTSYLTFGSAGGMIGGVDNLAVTQVSSFQSNVLVPASNVSLTNSGATLQLTDVNQTVASLTGVPGSSVKIGLFSRLTVNDASNNTFNGVISGAGNLAKSGAGTLTLTATSTYTGSTTVSGGTLLLGGNVVPVSVNVPNAGFENTGSLGGGAWAYGPTGADWSFDGAGISSNNQPWINTAPEGTHAGFIQGSFISQTLNFSTATTYDISFQAANRPDFNPTGLQLRIDGVTVATLPAAGFQTDAGFRSYSFTAIPIAAGLRNIGFYADNTFGGDVATAIDAISISSPVGALPSGTALNITAAGATVDLNGHDQTVGSLAGVAGAIVRNIAAFTAGGDDTSTSYAGTISGPGSFTKVGEGTLTISGVLSYLGATNASGGTTRFEVSETLSALNIADGAIVELGSPAPPAPGFEEGAALAAAAPLPVPEPGTAMLLLLGSLAAMGRFRRRSGKSG